MKHELQPEPPPQKRPKQPTAKSNRKPPARGKEPTMPAAWRGGPFARRWARIVGNPPKDEALKAMALALCTFDQATDPDELRRTGHKSLADDVMQLTQYLTHRALLRAAFALRELPFEPPATERSDKAWVRKVSRVEALTRSALVRAFPPRPGTQLDMRGFEHAMAAFVGGEMRLGRLCALEDEDELALHGTPDGPAYVCFAEAVLLFLRLGMHPSFWDPTLRTLVGTMPSFFARHWDRARRTWQSYRATATVTPTDSVLAAVDHGYAALSRSQLASRFATMLANALRDERMLPHANPTAKEFQ